MPAYSDRHRAPIMSGTTVAVDGHVFLGEVAGQHPVAAATEPERDLERDLGLLHRRRDGGLVIGGVALASVGHADAAEPDREPVAVGAFARLADRPHHAAPSGVLAGDFGLDELGGGNAARDFTR